MLDHIATYEQLESEAIKIDSYLQETCSEDPNEAILRGNEIQVHLSRTGKMLADAKFMQDEAVKNSIIAELGKKIRIPPSILKQLVEASCKKENYMVNWTERLNKTCVHQLDFLRTVISFAKADYNNTKPF
jgi:hypothetical protein